MWEYVFLVMRAIPDHYVVSIVTVIGALIFASFMSRRPVVQCPRCRMNTFRNIDVNVFGDNLFECEVCHHQGVDY